MKEKLKELKEKVENIEISYDYEQTYCDLINATIDYQNDTQTWDFEYIFEEFIDDELLEQAIQYNLKEYGVWAVRNLLDDIKYDDGIYKVDAYGYGHNITVEDLEYIKEQIIDIINDKLEEEK